MKPWHCAIGEVYFYTAHDVGDERALIASSNTCMIPSQGKGLNIYHLIVVGIKNMCATRLGHLAAQFSLALRAVLGSWNAKYPNSL